MCFIASVSIQKLSSVFYLEDIRLDSFFLFLARLFCYILSHMFQFDYIYLNSGLTMNFISFLVFLLCQVVFTGTI